MIPASFEYVAAATLGEAFGLLKKHPDAKILAGGHSLIPMMKFRVAQPALLIDINKVPDLAYIKEDAKWLKQPNVQVCTTLSLLLCNGLQNRFT